MRRLTRIDARRAERGATLSAAPRSVGHPTRTLSLARLRGWSAQSEIAGAAPGACRRWGDCRRSAQTPKHARFSAFHAKESLNYPISVNGTLIEWCAGLCGEALGRSGEIRGAICMVRSGVRSGENKKKSEQHVARLVEMQDGTLHPLLGQLEGTYFSDKLHKYYVFRGIRQLNDGRQQLVIVCKGCEHEFTNEWTKKGSEKSWSDLKDKFSTELSRQLSRTHKSCKVWLLTLISISISISTYPYPPSCNWIFISGESAHGADICMPDEAVACAHHTLQSPHHNPSYPHVHTYPYPYPYIHIHISTYPHIQSDVHV